MTVLARWNGLPEEDAAAEIISVCAATRWARGMAQARPLADAEAVYSTADRVWDTMTEPDWMEAIASHPRIGERNAVHASEQSHAWSRGEQSGAADAEAEVMAALAQGNAAYEEKFGITYIVCATGKSAAEMLAILERRLGSTREAELREAAEQQRLITRIRLGKWMQQV